MSLIVGVGAILILIKSKKNVQISRLIFTLLIAFYIVHLISVSWSINMAEALFESQRIFLTISIVLTAVLIYSNRQNLLNFHFAVVFFSWIALIICTIDVLISKGDSSIFFGHVNILSSFLLGLSVILFAGFYHLKGNWRFISFRTGYLVMIFLAYVMTRSVVVAATVCFVLGFAIVMLKSVKQKRIFLLTYLALGIIGGIVIILYPELVPDPPNSIKERFGLWDNTLQLIQENPVYGVGVGNWQFHYTKFGVEHLDKTAFYNINFRRPHNDFLGILAEAGIIGLLIFLALAFIITRKFVKNISLPIDKLPIHLYCGLLGYMIISYFSFPKERILHLFFFAIILAILLLKLYPKNQKGINSKFVGALILLGMSFNIYIGAQRINGEYFTMKSVEAQIEGNGRLAIHYGNKALSPFYITDPSGVPVHTYIGWGYDQATKLDSLQYHSEMSYNYAPNNYAILTNFGYVLQRQKNFKQAEELYLKAYDINTRYEPVIVNLSALEYNRGNYQKALEWLQKVEGYEVKYPGNVDRIMDHLN